MNAVPIHDLDLGRAPERRTAHRAASAAKTVVCALEAAVLLTASGRSRVGRRTAITARISGIAGLTTDTNTTVTSTTTSAAILAMARQFGRDATGGGTSRLCYAYGSCSSHHEWIPESNGQRTIVS